jgi:hypothetical protein
MDSRDFWWTPHKLQVESRWSPNGVQLGGCGVILDPKNKVHMKIKSPDVLHLESKNCGILWQWLHMDSTKTPETPNKLHMESMWTPCGLHVELWLSVKHSKNPMLKGEEVHQASKNKGVLRYV